MPHFLLFECFVFFLNYSNQLFQVVIEPFSKKVPPLSPADKNKNQYMKIMPQKHTMKNFILQSGFRICNENQLHYVFFVNFFSYRPLILRFKLCSFYIKNIENNLNL